MGQTNYDEASRHLNRNTEGAMMRWFLRMDEEQVRFERWMDSLLFTPGVKQRLVDAVAHLTDLTQGGKPFAGLVEFQTRPDFDMPGRMMVAGGLCLLTVRPTGLPGDRFALCAIVVNL